MLPPGFKLSSVGTPVEPLTLADAKNYLRVSNDDDNDLITDIITAARIKAEQIANASLAAETYLLTADYLPFGGFLLYWGNWLSTCGGDGFAAAVVELPNPPLVAVQSIAYVGMDGVPHTLDPATYRVSPGTPGQVAPAYGYFWPFLLPEIQAVQIAYTAGADPSKLAAVRQAMRLMVSHLYERRTADADIPQAIQWVLDPARNYGYA